MLLSDVYKGINPDEVEERRQHFGNNKLNIYIEQKIKSAVKSTMQPYLFIYLAVVIALYVNKNYLIASISVITFIAMFSMKVYLEVKDIKQYKPFLNLNDDIVTVIRGHNTLKIKAEELVVGDIVEIKTNTVVPADIRITECENLKTFEKNLTGEKFIIEKYATKVEDKVTSFTEMRNILFKGTTVVSGTGYGIVVGTGINTEIGKIINSMATMKEKNNGFMNGLYFKLNKCITIGTLIVIAAAVIQKVVFDNLSSEMIGYFLATLATMFPIISVFVNGIMIKRVLLSHGIEIIRMGAIDKIPETNMIFIPKEGGICEKSLKVKQIYVNNKLEYIHNIENINSTFKRLIEISVLCNDAVYDPDTDKGKGEYQDMALLKMAYKRDIFRGNLLKTQDRIFEIPFDSDRRMMTTVNRFKKKYRVNLKGAVDEVIVKCTHIMKDGVEVEITSEDIDNIKAADFKMSDEGYTTIAIAYRNFGYQPSEDENIESNLVFVGMVGFESKMIEDIKDKVTELRGLGVTPIVFTDDNKITSASMGKSIGMARNVFNIMSGVELENMKKDEFEKTVLRTKIFSRVNNDLKSRILDVFIKDEKKVAMLGENINDIVMLKASHLSVSNGAKCPSTVKKLSDIYMKKDYISGFTRLFRYEKLFTRNLNLFIQFIMFVLIAELAMIFTLHNLGFLDSINLYVLAVFNIIGMPLILQPVITNSADKVNSIRFYNYLPGALIEAVAVIICLDLRTDLNSGFIIFMSFISATVITTVIQNKINIFKDKLNVIIYSVIAAIVLGIIVFTWVNFSLTKNDLYTMGGLWILFILIEFLLEKWRQ